MVAGIFFDDESFTINTCSTKVEWVDSVWQMPEFLRLKAGKVRIFLLNQVPTMTVPRWSWRKSLGQEKGDIICTRLILPAVFPAVKKHEIQRGSVRTICLSKCPSRTVKGGAWPELLTIPIHDPPRQADNSYLLTKFNGNCCSNTRPGSQKSSHHF